MAVGDIVSMKRVDRYHVEIRHPGQEGWAHIHHPDWEDTPSLGVARRYRDQVQADHPGSEARIVVASGVRVTELATGDSVTVGIEGTVTD
jgi:hypothetical protein